MDYNFSLNLNDKGYVNLIYKDEQLKMKVDR